MAGEKILIVDDEFDTLRLVGLMLERQGYKIVAADSGDQALEMLKKDVPDLILLDVMMPGMDGVEVTRRIRANPLTEDVPIIMFTAKAQVEDKITGLEAGVDVYLTKPTQPRELFAQVKVLLARSQKMVTQPLPVATIRGQMIGALSAKGGLGVTSLVINLGITIRKLTKRDVLIADFHPGRGDIGWELGFTDPRGLDRLLDIMPDEITLDDIQKEIVAHESGLKLLMASQHPIDATQILQVEQFKAIATQLPIIANWILIDLGSTLMPATQSAAKMCDELIIVVEPAPNNVRQTKSLLTDLRQMGVNEGRMRLVLNNRIRSSVQLNWTQVEEELEHKIVTVFTPAPELAFQAAITNSPMVLQQPESITAQQYKELASTITKYEAK